MSDFFFPWFKGDGAQVHNIFFLKSIKIRLQGIIAGTLAKCIGIQSSFFFFYSALVGAFTNNFTMSDRKKNGI